MTVRRALPVLAAAVALGAPACAPALAAARTPAPPLAARAAAVFESSTAKPVFARAGGQRRLIASTTKLMTALVTRAARLPLTHVCTAPPYSAMPAESEIGLRAGERMTVHDLLQAAMLPSANDAAAALAVCVAGSRAAFVARMNAHARALGLRNTHFTTPIGLDDPGNYSSAAGIVRIAIAARRDGFLRRTMDLPRATLTSGDHRRTIVNRNTLVLRVPWVNGVKTGHTDAAGYILVASGTRRGTTFVASVLGDPSEAARDADALALLRWAFASWRVAAPVVRGAVYARPAVAQRPGERVDVVATRTLRELLRRDARVRLVVQAPDELTGPLPRGAVVGSVAVRSGGRTLARVALVTRRAVPAVGLLERVRRALDGPGSLVVAVLLAGAALLLVRARGARRRARRRADMEAA